MIRRPAMLATLLGLTTACAMAPTKNYDDFRAAAPRSILVVPVVNNSTNVEAPSLFLSTLPVPVGDMGYYVFPTHLVARVLEDDGLADAHLVHQADPMRLCSLFGADAVLYVTIQDWTAQYAVLDTSVLVAFEYALKDGKTGKTLWSDYRVMHYSSSSSTNSSSGGLLGQLVAMAVTAAITKAAPNYMGLARQANGLLMDSQSGLLEGPYFTAPLPPPRTPGM